MLCLTWSLHLPAASTIAGMPMAEDGNSTLQRHLSQRDSAFRRGGNFEFASAYKTPSTPGNKKWGVDCHHSARPPFRPPQGLGLTADGSPTVNRATEFSLCPSTREISLPKRLGRAILWDLRLDPGCRSSFCSLFVDMGLRALWSSCSSTAASNNYPSACSSGTACYVAIAVCRPTWRNDPRTTG